jgi:TPR repeat protein
VSTPNDLIENGAQDEDEAVSLITEAALEGHAISQFNLGIIYYYQVPRDPEKAEYWLSQAAENGDSQALEYIDEWF